MLEACRTSRWREVVDLRVVEKKEDPGEMKSSRSECGLPGWTACTHLFTERWQPVARSTVLAHDWKQHLLPLHLHPQRPPRRGPLTVEAA